MADYYNIKFSSFELEKKMTKKEVLSRFRSIGFPSISIADMGLNVEGMDCYMDDSSQSEFMEEDQWNGIVNNPKAIVSLIQSLMSANSETTLRIKCKNDSTDCVQKDIYRITKKKYEFEMQSYNPDD
jgi:hypothetical protein